MPLYLVASDTQGNRKITRRLSALNFTQGMANLMGISSPQLDPDYALFKDGPDDIVRPSRDVGGLREDPVIDMTASLTQRQ